jgi:D-tyrosyl-tRNA(Tyr) deacylase
MRAVVQRVSKASVSVQGETVGSIEQGLVVLLGIHAEDSEPEAKWMADKIVHLRIFEDENGKMNRSLVDIGKEMLIISQFTLYGDCRKGRRPGYSSAAPPEKADALYQKFIELVGTHEISTATGRFQEMMEVNICNSGPVTLLLDSDKTF